MGEYLSNLLRRATHLSASARHRSPRRLWGTSPEFWNHYNRLLKGREPVPAKRNFEGLILSYFESDAFKKLKPRTKADYRKYIGHIRTIWGAKDPAKIDTHHIYKLHLANRDRWRQGNPAHGIPLFKQPGEGWLPWPDEVRAEFEAVAPPRARLVYELCIGTGQRIGDVLKFRWSHFSEGAFDFTKGKGDKPMWVPMTDRLRTYLTSVEKKGLTVVTDLNGRPSRYEAVAEEMRKVKASMKHPVAMKYVTHGLRKNATIELCQSGCDDEMVKSVTGHSGVEMLRKYGGMIRQRELATRAQAARNRAEQNKPGT